MLLLALAYSPPSPTEGGVGATLSLTCALSPLSWRLGG
jgi:hypothetical protein